MVVRAQERTGGREAVCAGVADNSQPGGGVCSLFEGVSALNRSTKNCATYVAGVWELGIVRAAKVVIAGQQVVGGRLAGIASSSGGTIVDTQARSTLDQILTAMRQHGLIET